MPAITASGLRAASRRTSAIVSSSVRIVAGRERGSARSISARAPPFQRRVRRAVALSRSTLTMTSSSSVRSSSFRSRGVVVAACQTAARSAPSARRRPRSSWESARGRASSRRESSALASDQAVVGIDGAVAALGAARFVACPLDAETPLPERGLTIGLEPLRGGDSGGELCRLEGGDEGPGDGLVDLDGADVEAIDAAALDQDLAGAMIPRREAASAIVRVQAASAVAAGGKALQ